MIHFVFFFLFLSLVFSACGPSSLGPPRPSQTDPSANASSFRFDLEDQIHLAAKFQVRNMNGALQYETSIPVEWVPRKEDRPDLGKTIQVLPKAGFQLSNVKAGNYLFRIVLFHQSENQGNITVASIETDGSVSGAQNTVLDFSKSDWNYQFDDDQDGFSNIAELTAGAYEDPPTNKSWEFHPTDTKNSEEHPSALYLIALEKITPTSPDSQNNSKLVGDLKSVQAGTNFVLMHLASDGKTVKEKINFSSRIDGSFEVDLKNSEEGDQMILILASKLNGDQLPDLSTKESQGYGKWFKVTYPPLKIIHCRSFPDTDPIAGKGYALIEGEGIGSDPTTADVRFPAVGGGQVYASEISIAWEGPKSRELKVKMPDHAISGYPIVHLSTPRMTSGECPTDQPVVVLQAGGALPDLYIPRIDPPFVALLGRTISIDYPIVNQGLFDLGTGPFPYHTFISQDIVGVTADIDKIRDQDREIFPNSEDLYKLPPGATAPAFSDLNKGESFLAPPPRNEYFISTLSENPQKFIGSVLFKAKVDPLVGTRAEQDPNNNSRAALHNTFIHYMDLRFSLLSDAGKEGINFNGNFLSLVPDQNFYKTDAAQTLSKTDKFLLIKLGRLSNQGTFPMIRQKSGDQETQYLPDPKNNFPNDPLVTSGQVYQAAKKLYDARDRAEGEDDLKKSPLIKLVEEVDLFNRRTELPILVHVYYSTGDIFNPSNAAYHTTLLKCSGDSDESCEFCINRLEQKQSIGRGIDRVPSPTADSIYLKIPLDENTLSNGFLYIVAEAIQIDPNKVNRDGVGFNYCAVSPQEREKMHLVPLGATGDRTPLLGYQPSDNIIRVPIKFK